MRPGSVKGFIRSAGPRAGLTCPEPSTEAPAPPSSRAGPPGFKLKPAPRRRRIVLNSFAWIPGSGLVKDPPREKFAEIIAREDAVLWVDMEAATPSEIGLLRKPFNVHPTAVDECRDHAVLPKVENYGDYILVTLHRVQFEEATREMSLREIDFVLAKNWLVTVRTDASTSVEEVQRKLLANEDLMREGPGRLMAEIVEQITSRYFPMVEFLEREIDVLEEAMLEQRIGTVDPFGRILALRRTVVALRRTLVPQREVIHRLAKEEFRLAAGNTALRLRGTHDELYWILTELEIHRELLTSAFEGHAAMGANRLAEISNRMNRVMEKLTRFTTIFMPLTLITGVYGMNFRHMPELEWRWAYPVLMALLVVTGFVLSWYFRKTLPPGFVEGVEDTDLRLQTRVFRKGEKPDGGRTGVQVGRKPG
jgi:magnesium transporter